jgi:D-glycero-alpha-D-manno-heptose 1-phosphate guanylyltransferase
MKTALILAGGLGTRLKHLLDDIPKPMAPIKGKPFLHFIIDNLIEAKFERIVFSLGYRAEVVSDYFGHSAYHVKFDYITEPEQLGTGGAIKHGIIEAGLMDEDILYILNGDTYCDIPFDEMLEFHQENNSDLTISAKTMQNFDRYGTIEISESGKIQKFQEKMPRESGIINTGIYIVKPKTFLAHCPVEEKFSFEKDIMEKNVNILNIYAFLNDGFFIDIGIPEDYEKAQNSNELD